MYKQGNKELGEKKKAHKPLGVKYDITVHKYYAENFFCHSFKNRWKIGQSK